MHISGHWPEFYLGIFFLFFLLGYFFLKISWEVCCVYSFLSSISKEHTAIWWAHPVLKLFLPQLINLATKLKEYAYFFTFLRLNTTFFQRQVHLTLVKYKRSKYFLGSKTNLSSHMVMKINMEGIRLWSDFSGLMKKY